MMPAVGDIVEWRTPIGSHWHRPYEVLHVADLDAHGHLVAVVLVLPDGSHDDWPHADGGTMTDTWDLCDKPGTECGLHTDRNGEPKCYVARRQGDCPGMAELPSLWRLPAIPPVIEPGVPIWHCLVLIAVVVLVASCAIFLVAVTGAGS